MYVKLFSSILTSSVWSEDVATRIVWITLLALADKSGDVRCSPSGLARTANVSQAEAAAAISKFLSPDPESGTEDYEGRRVEELPGGWHILNYAKYRALQDVEDRKEQWRQSSAKHRDKKRQQTSAISENGHGISAQAEADTEADTKTTSSSSAEMFDPMVEELTGDHQLHALECYRRVARNPQTLWLTLKGFHDGLNGKPWAWPEIGQALFEMQQSEVAKVTTNTLQGWLTGKKVPPTGRADGTIPQPVDKFADLKAKALAGQI